MQLFLGLSVGLISGRTFDAGYLWVFLMISYHILSSETHSYHLMIGGSILMVFCIFMISVTKPEQYYQACIFTSPTSTDLTNIPPKLFLSQGLGIGIAVGITYIPSIGIISHYFQRRRALALGIATSVGCHPLLFMFTLIITEPGLCFWRSDSPHYTEFSVSWIRWVSLRCKNQCWIGR